MKAWVPAWLNLSFVVEDNGWATAIEPDFHHQWILEEGSQLLNLLFSPVLLPAMWGKHGAVGIREGVRVQINGATEKEVFDRVRLDFLSVSFSK